ncbi:hypothetical protein [Fluviicola sp.]|uniref:hypothetical protein n=1 Tax=Fluviicola sp. TaxID=1917219 RepID=UPI003D2C95AA
MPYSEKDLLYTDYTDKAADSGDNPNIRGGIERDELNRKQKYEILPFINKFVEENLEGYIHLGTYRKVETMIREHLPSEIVKHDEITIWLRQNWTKY